MGTDDGAPKVGGIYAAMVKVAAGVSAIAADEQAPATAGGFNYRGIKKAMDGLHALLTESGIFVLVESDHQSIQDVQTKRGDTWKHVSALVTVHFVHQDGSRVSCTVPAEGQDSSDKGSNKLISNALKYALFTSFTVPYNGPGGLLDSESDQDPNAEPKKATRNPRPSRPQRRQSPQQGPPPGHPAAGPEPAQQEHRGRVFAAADLQKFQANHDNRANKEEKTTEDLQVITWARCLLMAKGDEDAARDILQRVTRSEKFDGWRNVQQIPAQKRPKAKTSALQMAYVNVGKEYVKHVHTDAEVNPWESKAQGMIQAADVDEGAVKDAVAWLLKKPNFDPSMWETVCQRWADVLEVVRGSAAAA